MDVQRGRAEPQPRVWSAPCALRRCSTLHASVRSTLAGRRGVWRSPRVPASWETPWSDVIWLVLAVVFVGLLFILFRRPLGSLGEKFRWSGA